MTFTVVVLAVVVDDVDIYVTVVESVVKCVVFFYCLNNSILIHMYICDKIVTILIFIYVCIRSHHCH